MIAKCRYILLLLSTVCLGWQSCSRRALDEAQRVVAEADSLWHEGKMYGIDEGDSLSLAQAYETLGRYSAFYSLVHRSSSLATYAHACYHYGRLLRKKDDPVAAMQVFINATHSRTDDLHTLGRVYSNMGTLCHLAGEYPLSYDMYEKSADMYLQNGDTLLYYYGLYSMAFEKSEIPVKDEAMHILNHIDSVCADTNVIALAVLAKAELYLRVQQYDSAIYYAREAHNCRVCPSISSTILAQAYSYLQIRDSAVRYATLVVSEQNDLYNLNNALYILTNDDESKDKESIRQTAAHRADVQKLLEIRQGKLAQAVQLLELDLNRKPDLRWLYAIMITALLTGGAFYWHYRVRKQQMRSQVEQMIERQNDNVTQSIKQHIDVNDLTQTLHWKNYAAMKADADLYIGGIVSKLEEQNLNETEIRFCLLTMLNFSLSRTAETIHYSYPSGIKTLKKRISVKLGTKPPILRNFLFDLASKA